MDRTTLMTLLADDIELATQILATYVEDTADRLAGLRLAVERDDLAAAVREAHVLKGAAANIGARPMSEAAVELERAAKAGGGELVQARLSDLERRFAELKSEILRGD